MLGFMMDNEQQTDVREQQTDGTQATGVPECYDQTPV